MRLVDLYLFLYDLFRRSKTVETNLQSFEST